METVPCRMNDGVCTIPDHAVTVQQGLVSVRPRTEIVRDFPSLDLRISNLRPFEFDGTQDDLLAEARRLETLGEGGDTSFDEDEGGGGVAMMESLGLHAAVEAAIGEAQVINGLVVFCAPCGHRWIVDL